MMKTRCRRDGDDWIIDGHKAFITGAQGASVGIVMARSDDGACLFLIDLPYPAVRVERLLDTIDSSMPGGHAVVAIDQLRVPQHHMLGASGEGFRYAQVRSEEHTSELQSRMRNSYAVFCLEKKKITR